MSTEMCRIKNERFTFLYNVYQNIFRADKYLASTGRFTLKTCLEKYVGLLEKLLIFLPELNESWIVLRKVSKLH
jgi:hypothetical protein